ncbi:hypothetical protein I350_06051 [Cryptococcus amylolentus CBS 6273]|uniref:CRAL-TRIO domain-containing protein n=1 Tax=Cryptococcus amylolentus CBS 6273 TaxID=1296118 RepID=A0A1E3JRB5_9TREE|nr:hypothetical protein I350_06051 [Cryptococcus amylolentus CBS 6273]
MRMLEGNTEYTEHLETTRGVQAGLAADVDALSAQEGWDDDTRRGVHEWVGDTASVWRCLRRNRYDTDKTHALLLSTLATRLDMALHSPLPAILPYTDTPLFHILPLPLHTDRQGRPVAVLTVREIRRDDEGRLDDVKEWMWWALEMCRRTTRDWWGGSMWDGSTNRASKKKAMGQGGEGLVLVVDAAGAGYLDLLPTLLSIGHNNFPGLLEAVYIVNARWTHQSMWSVVKHLLPKSALERVDFIDSKAALEKKFEMGRLPRALGGESDYDFAPSNNPIYTYYSHHPSYPPTIPSANTLSRTSSATSIADIYYSSRNTPLSSLAPSPLMSRRNSSTGHLRRVGSGFRTGYGERLRMTKSRDEKVLLEPVKEGMKKVASAPDVVAVAMPDDNAPASRHLPVFDSSTTTSAAPSPPHQEKHYPHTHSSSAVQRIKSISDFHLYLSPSRLANIDLLSDSDPEDDHPPPPPVPLTQRRKFLRPALLDHDLIPPSGQVPQPQKRPSLQISGVPRHMQDPAADAGRTYSGMLQEHHAKWLKEWTGTREELGLKDREKQMEKPVEPEETKEPVKTISVSPPAGQRPASPVMLEPPSLPTPFPSPLPSPPTTSFSIKPYSSSNPFFGYPVVQSGNSIHPRYPRRKRDLAKTLLFLLMLKLQSWMDALERAVGLNQLHMPGFFRRPSAVRRGMGPSEGLVRSMVGGSLNGNGRGKGSRQVKRKGSWDKDWWWMIIGVLLLRGTWGRLILAPLEALGFGTGEWRGAFGAGG